MPTTIAILLLVSTAVVCSHIIVLVGRVVPYAFFEMFRLDSWELALVMMPDITRMAYDYVWIFPVALGLITFGLVPFLRIFPEKAVHFVALGMSGQGLVTWAAMFCFFWEVFTGPISLHHDAEFELEKFLNFGAGVFPMSLAMVVLTAVWTLRAVVKTLRRIFPNNEVFN